MHVDIRLTAPDNVTNLLRARVRKTGGGTELNKLNMQTLPRSAYSRNYRTAIIDRLTKVTHFLAVFAERARVPFKE